MRVLFLDVDGVLNRLGYSPQESEGLRSWIEPELGARLDALCRATGAVLVMSSSWRIDRSHPELCAELAAAGVTTPLYGATPFLQTGGRHREIAAWLEAHRAEDGEPVEAFAIVDDGYDMGPLTPHFVRVSPLTGLDEAAAAKLRALLSPLPSP